MIGLTPCEITPPHSCPEHFRASASEWIDQTNFGDLPDGKAPPAGIRLRWNWPMPGEGTPQAEGEPAFPDRFVVYRSHPIPDVRLMKPRVTVGHLPRMYAPNRLWKDLLYTGDRELEVGAEPDADPCAGAQAIYIVMAGRSPRVSIALIDSAGETRLTGTLEPGDAFYYEIGDIRRVVFSSPPAIEIAKGLSLSARDANAADIGFQAIARLDARAWLNASLSDASERMASEQLPPFVTITDSEWQALQQRGNNVMSALDARAVPTPQEMNYVQLATALRWEIAALVGLGFLDGEHVAAPHLDGIDLASMLTPDADGVYAYQIVAESNTDDQWSRFSDIALTVARPMPALIGASVRVVSSPTTRGELVNHLSEPVPAQSPRTTSPAAERAYCTSNWQITTRAPYAERVFTIPRAADSQIVADQVEVAGEFSADGARRAAEFRGMERIEHRDHAFPVPFYDSDIWLTLATGDYWDRRIAQRPTQPIQPEVVYEGRCIELASGTSDSVQRAVQASLDLNANPGWTADRFATFARATIELLIKKPALEELSADVKLYAASPVAGGTWRAVIETDLTTDALALFIGGNLSTEGFHGRIVGFVPEQRGRFRCEFESIAVCAGATLYKADPNGVAAKLSEAEGSDRVWEVGGGIPLLLDGAPGSGLGTIKLPELTSSQMLYCSTRLRFEFEGTTYRSHLSTRIGVPYVHPAPKPPELCVDVRTLAVDFYGRAVIRVEAVDCERFDPTLAVSVQAAAGIVSNGGTFSGAASKGVFGPQTPLGSRVLFDAFGLLGNRPDGSVDTIGISYVRREDGRDSEPHLQPFENRRTN
ncbi:hypothetical protein C8J38_11247 [Rhizobium sp. PP-WC-2G-219]|nr:hypothetical protein C8J38_11247 [Rhizobium sp. PP-WC-2G-219]